MCSEAHSCCRTGGEGSGLAGIAAGPGAAAAGSGCNFGMKKGHGGGCTEKYHGFVEKVGAEMVAVHLGQRLTAAASMSMLANSDRLRLMSWWLRQLHIERWNQELSSLRVF